MAEWSYEQTRAEIREWLTQLRSAIRSGEITARAMELTGNPQQFMDAVAIRNQTALFVRLMRSIESARIEPGFPSGKITRLLLNAEAELNHQPLPYPEELDDHEAGTDPR